MLVGNECAILVLRLHVAVDIFHEKKLLESIEADINREFYKGE